MPLLEDRALGVINAAPLGMGMFSQRGLPYWHPATEPMRGVCRMAAEHCAAKGSNISKLAIQFSLDQPRIATTIVGTAFSEDVQRNLAWADEPIDRDLLAEVFGILGPIRNQSWTVGRSENN
jgi:aryl-alcohol dehydrogenase-like predicted oxidoreductase